MRKLIVNLKPFQTLNIQWVTFKYLRFGTNFVLINFTNFTNSNIFVIPRFRKLKFEYLYDLCKT